jgi:hypothetical protein
MKNEKKKEKKKKKKKKKKLATDFTTVITVGVTAAVDITVVMPVKRVFYDVRFRKYCRFHSLTARFLGALPRSSQSKVMRLRNRGRLLVAFSNDFKNMPFFAAFFFENVF